MSNVGSSHQSLRGPLALTALMGIAWLCLWFDWRSLYQVPNEDLRYLFPSLTLPTIFWWLRKSKRLAPLARYAIYSICFVPIWHLAVFAFHEMGWTTLQVAAARTGLCISFVVGLGWTTWWVERKSRAYQLVRMEITGASSIGPLKAMQGSMAGAGEGGRIWNPIDLDAWYYGEKKQKLNQSLSVLFGYLVAFIVLFILLLWVGGCQEIYEMPAGGGEQKQLQQIRVKRVITKKFIINPLSAVVFDTPPEEFKIEMLEATEHTYKVGHGKGTGAGFAGGTNRGKVRFIRLEYSGGDWDQGIDADRKMLLEYNIRTQHKVAKDPETRKISQLKNFRVGKSPPMVYMTGQKSIHLGKSEKEALHKYLTEMHGMVFADNGGHRNWGNNFKSLIRQVLPNANEIKIPLDHPIHRIPYAIPFLPYVVPHDGKNAIGWVLDGRLAVYYHPGDIGDAWAENHAGVPTQIWEYCYQLGTNVIFYAHAEYSKWLEKRKKSD